VNTEQASKRRRGSRPDVKAGKADVLREASDIRTVGFRRGIWWWHACTRETKRNTGSLDGGGA